MNRIDQVFKSARAEGRGVLMPFLVGGRPSVEALPVMLADAHAAGAGIVEVGIPFSDPIADGPVIAEAMDRALRASVTPTAVFESVRQARASGAIGALGVVAMVSVSIVSRAGGPGGSEQAFAARAAASGFDGLIVPDLPLEEADTARRAAADAGLTLSMLVGPATSPKRAEALARASTGFVYLLARAGVTGERREIVDVAERVARLREATDLPIAVGFGVSSAEHVRAVVRSADAAIVGSSLVRRVEAGEPVRRVVEELAAGLRPSPPAPPAETV